MSNERESHVRHYREFELIDGAIEVQGPNGVKRIAAPSDWDTHDLTALRQVVEAIGGTTVAPQTDSLFAYGPKIKPDEISCTTPFDADHRSMIERLQLIPGTRVHNLRETARGLSGRIHDYGSRRTMDLRLDDVQPELQVVRSD